MKTGKHIKPKGKKKIITINTQPGPQSALTSCPCDEIFYGGARGGGKSYGSLLDWYKHQLKHGKYSKGILFRRTYPELEDIVEKSRLIFPLFGAKYLESKRTWIFKNGSKLKLRYLDKDKDAGNYQGHEYTWMGFDEAGRWPSPKPIDMLRACLRSPTGIPVRFILTGNPGGPGHNWLKLRFIDPVSPEVVQKIVQPDGSVWTRVFIFAKVQDNKILLKSDPGYIGRLHASGPDWLVRAWLDGDWDIIAGGAIDDIWKRNVHVIKPFIIPSTWRVNRAFDWGSSKPFSTGWWAVSDGTTALLSNGTERTFYPGTQFRICEWYGWKKGRPNEGLKMLNKDIAKGILDIEENKIKKSTYGKLIGEIHPGPADSSIFDVIDGSSMYNAFEDNGCRFIKSNKRPGSRVAGLEKLRDMLKASLSFPMEDPGLFVFDICNDGFIRTIPTLQRDEKNPDDVDTTTEDHSFDETRYQIYRRKASVGEASHGA